MPVVAPEERREARPLPARRGVWSFGLVALGFVCGRELEAVDPLVFVAMAMALLLAALLTRGWTCRGALALGLVLFSAGWIGVRTSTADSRTRWAAAVDPYQGAVVTIEGMVTSRVRVSGPAHGAIVLDSPPARRRSAAFELVARNAVLESEARRAIRGGVTVIVDDAAAPDVAPGDFVRVTGVFTPVAGPLNPGEPDRRVWARERGKVGRLRVASAELIEAARGEPGAADRLASGFLKMAGAVRGRVADAFDALAGPADGADADGRGRHRALLAVLLLGEREEGIEEVEGAFARTGLVHVLAISGFHLAVLAWGVLWLVRLTGEREMVEGLAVGGVVLLYLVLVPGEAPVLRCGVTLLVFLAVHAWGRRYDRLNTLAWVAIGLVLWRPSDLWSPGFQLSFGVVAALLLCGDATVRRFFGTPIRIGPRRAGAGIHPGARSTARQLADFAWRHGKSLMASSVLCWAVASPLVAYHAGWFSPFAAATSVVVIPMAALLLCVGYAALVAGAVSPALGEWVGGPARWMADALASGIEWIDGLGWSAMPLPLLGAWWTAFATVAVVLVFSWRVRPRWAVWSVFGAAAVWLAGELALRGRLAPGVLLRIDTLAVGDGTCHVVRSRRPGAAWWGRDEVVLWDAGSLRADIGLRDLTRAIRCAGGGGVWRVPTVFVTHPNTDHYIAIPELMRPLGVRRLVMSETFSAAAAARPDGPPSQLLGIANSGGVEVDVFVRGDEFSLEAARARVLWPPAGATFRADNDGSLVARFEVQTEIGPRALLLTGDIGREAMARLLGDPGLIGGAVLEAPHHGAFSDAAAEFIGRVNPDVVLQSTGVRRALDPRLDPLKQELTWYVTALDGGAWAEILADGTVRCGSLRRGGGRGGLLGRGGRDGVGLTRGP